MNTIDSAGIEYMRQQGTLSVGYRCPNCLFDIESFVDCKGEVIYCQCGNPIYLNSDLIKMCKCGIPLSSKPISFKCVCGKTTKLNQIEKYYTACVKED
jgi:hypothetical protein